METSVDLPGLQPWWNLSWGRNFAKMRNFDHLMEETTFEKNIRSGEGPSVPLAHVDPYLTYMEPKPIVQFK